MRGRVVRRRYWVELVLAALTGLALIATLVEPEWIEAVFGVEPDGGNGAVEWAIVAGLAVATAASALAARHEWVRAAPAR